MNVLYVSHSGGLDGAPKSLLEFVEVARNKGITPIVVLPNKGVFQNELHKKNIETLVISFKTCVYSDRLKARDWYRYIRTNIAAAMSLTKVVRERQIDLIHSNSLAVDIGAMASIITGVPHIWHFREFLEEDFGFHLNTPIITRYLVKKSKGIIAISHCIKRKYWKKYGLEPYLFYDGINAVLYSNTVLEHDADNNMLLLAGTISEGKGQWDAIRAVEILKKKGISVQLNIVGNGNPVYVNGLRRYIRQQGMAGCIQFKTYVPDLNEMRKKSAICLTCSRMEALGRVTAEAMMSGTIVIGASTGGTRELIGAKEQRGYLYPPGNPQELAEKIEYVLKNPAEVEQKEKRAQEFIVKLTDIEKYADKVINIYQKVVNRSDENE